MIKNERKKGGEGTINGERVVAQAWRSLLNKIKGLPITSSNARMVDLQTSLPRPPLSIKWREEDRG